MLPVNRLPGPPTSPTPPSRVSSNVSNVGGLRGGRGAKGQRAEGQMGCKPFPFVPRPSAPRPLKYFAALAPAKFPYAPLGRNTLLEPFPLPLDPFAPRPPKVASG